METYVTLMPSNDKDRSLNETATDKILKYRADYNNNPPQAVVTCSLYVGDR